MIFFFFWFWSNVRSTFEHVHVEQRKRHCESKLHMIYDKASGTAVVDKSGPVFACTYITYITYCIVTILWMAWNHWENLWPMIRTHFFSPTVINRHTHHVQLLYWCWTNTTILFLLMINCNVKSIVDFIYSCCRCFIIFVSLDCHSGASLEVVDFAVAG